jgi:hypothetical protein
MHITIEGFILNEFLNKKNLLYQRYTGIDAVNVHPSQVERVYKSIEVPLIYFINKLQRYPMSFHCEWLRRLFGKNQHRNSKKTKYIAVKEWLIYDLNYIEVLGSPTAIESYMARDNGFAKRFKLTSKLYLMKRLSRKDSMVEINMTEKDVEKIVKVKQWKSKEKQDYINSLNVNIGKIVIDTIPKSIIKIQQSKEFINSKKENRVPRNWTEYLWDIRNQNESGVHFGKTFKDYRVYSKMGSLPNDFRQYMHVDGIQLREIDVHAMNPRIHVFLCFEMPETFRDKYEEMQLRGLLDTDFYDFFARNLSFSRDEVKTAYMCIVNRKKDLSILINYNQQASELLTYIKKNFPKFGDFIENINTPDSYKAITGQSDHEVNAIFRDADDGKYPFNYLICSFCEYRFMKAVVETIIENLGNIGFMTVHDAIYVPEKYATQVEEIFQEKLLEHF